MKRDRLCHFDTILVAKRIEPGGALADQNVQQILQILVPVAHRRVIEPEMPREVGLHLGALGIARPYLKKVKGKYQELFLSASI